MEGALFHKYEGLGNDFVLVEADRDDAVLPSDARAVCDRRFGVGADGVLLLLPPRTPGAAATMRVINADGSVPEMCGNGLRCAVLHVARRDGAASGEIVFDTDAGVRTCVVDDVGGRGVVTVDMGVVGVGEDVRLAIGGEDWTVTLADAGNPHAVALRKPPREVIDAVGPRIATHARFPAGTNVEFTALVDGVVDLVVWERGVGVTLACGTGACAAVAVLVAKGRIAPDVETKVNLPGGALFVTVRADRRAIMRGPARRVFSGTIPRRGGS